ncbi:hypothetical protein CFP71_28280 [Amycolatopsis thailandensis]|uniref:Uncharacterized protein n=1 Tax=Amycolatopsis thailandensis TaxID=589330 RepID=A0A229RUJ7_9PSEU|nr:hypothetical protein [Amycolatopsis thailandensis]OXM50330.1 hypothetical protein CFP71_28280 [Amycolatopsis thailandensis]
MVALGVIVTVAVILLATGVTVILVLGGILAWYIRDAERRSERTFTRIHDPVRIPGSWQLVTDPDGPAGRPFRPVVRPAPARTAPSVSRHSNNSVSASI